jgi:hypothetical protein
LSSDLYPILSDFDKAAERLCYELPGQQSYRFAMVLRLMKIVSG